MRCRELTLRTRATAAKAISTSALDGSLPRDWREAAFAAITLRGRCQGKFPRSKALQVAREATSLPKLPS